jgi:hypothetical protein
MLFFIVPTAGFPSIKYLYHFPSPKRFYLVLPLHFGEGWGEVGEGVRRTDEVGRVRVRSTSFSLITSILHITVQTIYCTDQ